MHPFIHFCIHSCFHSEFHKMMVANIVLVLQKQWVVEQVQQQAPCTQWLAGIKLNCLFKLTILLVLYECMYTGLSQNDAQLFRAQLSHTGTFYLSADQVFSWATCDTGVTLLSSAVVIILCCSYGRQNTPTHCLAAIFQVNMSQQVITEWNF